MLTIEQIVTRENRKKRYIRDGIYDVTNVSEIIFIGADEGIENFHPESFLKRASVEAIKKVVDFCNKHPNWCVAEPYQTYSIYLLSESPTLFKGNTIGSAGHGANLLIDGCPAKLLILAEDD